MGQLNANQQSSPTDSWLFVEELKEPLWEKHPWTPRSVRVGEADLSGGLKLHDNFPDPGRVLETVISDLKRFCRAGDIALNGTYAIELEKNNGLGLEAFRVVVSADGCSVVAGGTEGMRRAIFYVQELMQQAGGPFLPLGDTERYPFVGNRISRCFFGPIKRPPLNRDELTDDMDYYPDEYLNRLAHQGVNGLWLTVSFRDLCRTRFFPSFGKDSDRRLEKLRRSVAKCARYGIRLFAFAIEPRSFGAGSSQIPVAAATDHPELLGHREGDIQYFCTGSEAGLAYLEESTRCLFQSVPGLGGLINISYGERPTHCYSGSHLFFDNNCPRCSKKAPAEVFATTADAMARGMHSVSPDAEFISWLYVPQIRETPGIDPTAVKAEIQNIAAHTPSSTTLQINFESEGKEMQLGRECDVLDYSLAHVGPSQLFDQCAEAAVRNGARASAKLQVGCSHEVATVPYVPVPGNIYRKYRRMRELGVTTAMQCWYFGNYPSLMNRAASRCSFEPFPETEDAFLAELAAPEWGGDSATVVEAWKLFRDAYGQFPANLNYSYYGPSHNGLTWPLHLTPADSSLAPSWLLGFAPSGDRIGECISYFQSFGEVLELSRRVADGWEQGVALLRPLMTHGPGSERLREIGVAEALGLQFRSAANILRFYALREELPWQSAQHQKESLGQMRNLVADEIRLGLRLADLADTDSRLGFHSEAEGYKYSPDELRQRAASLKKLLETGFEEASRELGRKDNLYDQFCGKHPLGPTVKCPRLDVLDEIPWDRLPQHVVSGPTESLPGFVWQTANDGDRIYFHIACPHANPLPPPDTTSWADGMDADRVLILVEPRRLWPPVRFHVDGAGRLFHDDMRCTMDSRTKVRVKRSTTHWEAVLEISMDSLREPELAGRPMRINVQRPHHLGQDNVSWIPLNPLRSRLQFGAHNPADLGWLLF